MSKSQTGSTEIAVRSSSDLAQLDSLEQLLISQERVEVTEDPEQISREIMMQLLAAETDEELEAMGTAIGWRELEGVPVEIRSFRWRPSAFEEGSNVFFVVQGVRGDTGEHVVLTTGSKNVLAQLVNMAKRGTLVGAVRAIRKADKPTKQGFTPLWLVTPQRAEQFAGGPDKTADR